MLRLKRAFTSSKVIVIACMSVAALAQQPAPKIATAQGAAVKAPHQPPCWQQAGISKAAMEQRREIEQGTRSQVQSVCADNSLTPQQKHAKIKEIRQQSRQQIESIITPQQLEELKACNTERNAGRTAAGAPHRGGSGLGPCGATASNAPASSGTENPPEPKQP
jgi:hypothetical protein